MLILRRDGVLWLNVPVRFATLVVRFTLAALVDGAFSIICRSITRRDRGTGERGFVSVCEVNIPSDASVSITEE